MRKPKDIKECIHFWANQVRDNADCGSVSFIGPKLYSYAACIARIMPGGRVVAFCDEGYSNTTQRHKSYANAATRHMERIVVGDPLGSPARNFEWARLEIDSLFSKANNPRIKPHTRIDLQSQALQVAKDANRYYELYEGEKDDAQPFDISSFYLLKESIDAFNEQQVRNKAAALARKQQALAEDLGKWRNHEDVYSSLHEIPPALRMSKDGTEVQTSHGARIPVGEAKRLWPLIFACREQKREMQMHKQLGHYTLTLIAADGDIVVGCHHIAYSEIEGIAKQLGLLEVQHG